MGQGEGRLFDPAVPGAVGSFPNDQNTIQAKDTEAGTVRTRTPLMLPSTTTLVHAARNMVDQNVSAVLVTEGEAEIVGIFTARDALTRVLANGRDPAKTTLADVMTYPPVTLAPDAAAIEALRLMQGQRTDIGMRLHTAGPGGRGE
jgi:CBS domain-containing protein